MKCEFLCLKCYLGPRNGILLQLFKVLCVCNTRVGQIRAGQIRVGHTRAHHCCEYTIADQPSIVLAAKVSFCPKYPRSSAIDNARVGRIRAGQIRVGHIRAHHCSECSNLKKQRQPSALQPQKYSSPP